MKRIIILCERQAPFVRGKDSMMVCWVFLDSGAQLQAIYSTRIDINAH